MSHPARFDPDDPLLARLRAVCLRFPGAGEKISHGRPNFFTRKIFAGYGAVEKGAHSSDRWARSVVILPDSAEREALLADPRFFRPGYLGAYGWIGLDLQSAEPDWDEITELVDASYRNTASRTLIAELDRSSSPQI